MPVIIFWPNAQIGLGLLGSGLGLYAEFSGTELACCTFGRKCQPKCRKFIWARWPRSTMRVLSTQRRTRILNSSSSSSSCFARRDVRWDNATRRQWCSKPSSPAPVLEMRRLIVPFNRPTKGGTGAFDNYFINFLYYFPPFSNASEALQRLE